MKIAGHVEGERLLLRLRNGEKRLAYAVANATNRTAVYVQGKEFENVRAKFQVRKPAFLFGTPGRPGGVAGKIAFANVRKGRIEAELLVGREAAAGRRDVLLARFERGGIRTPKASARGVNAGAVVVPITGGARPSFAAGIDPALRFSALRITAYKGKKRVKRPSGGGKRATFERGYGTGGSSFAPDFELQGVTWRGRLRTFYLPHAKGAPRGAVYQRTGTGSIRMLWKWVPSVPLDARLGAVDAARKAWRERYHEEFDREVRASLAFHGYNFTS